MNYMTSNTILYVLLVAGKFAGAGRVWVMALFDAGTRGHPQEYYAGAGWVWVLCWKPAGPAGTRKEIMRVWGGCGLHVQIAGRVWV